MIDIVPQKQANLENLKRNPLLRKKLFRLLLVQIALLILILIGLIAAFSGYFIYAILPLMACSILFIYSAKKYQILSQKANIQSEVIIPKIH